MYSILIFLSIFLNYVSSLTCYVPGQCLKSEFIGAIPANELNDCILSCKENSDCNWSTYYPEFSTCNLFTECNILEDYHCSGCITNMKECERIQCDVEGFCTVKQLTYGGRSLAMLTP